MVPLAVMTLEYAVMELRQLAARGLWRWATRSRNLLDAAQLGATAMVLLLHASCGASGKVLRGLCACTVLVLFWRLLDFSTVDDRMGRFVM